MRPVPAKGPSTTLTDASSATCRPSQSHRTRPGDFRVPDQLYVRDREGGLWHATAALVVAILSPDDEARRKLTFYFDRGVEEVLLVDPDGCTVEWLVRGDDAFEPADGSTLLAITSAELEAAIDWPG